MRYAFTVVTTDHHATWWVWAGRHGSPCWEAGIIGVSVVAPLAHQPWLLTHGALLRCREKREMGGIICGVTCVKCFFFFLLLSVSSSHLPASFFSSPPSFSPSPACINGSLPHLPCFQFSRFPFSPFFLLLSLLKFSYVFQISMFSFIPSFLLPLVFAFCFLSLPLAFGLRPRRFLLRLPPPSPEPPLPLSLRLPSPAFVITR